MHAHHVRMHGRAKHIYSGVGEQFFCVPHVCFDLGKLFPQVQGAGGQVSASGQHGHVTSGMATPSVAAPNAPLRAIQLSYDRISEPRAISLHAKEFYVGCVCDGTLWQQWRREKRRGAFGGGVVLSVRQAAQCRRAGFCVCTLGLHVQA